MAKEIQQALTILRRNQVEARTGLSRSTIYQKIKEGTFPAPVSLTAGRAVGWLESEVNAYLSDRITSSRNTNQGKGAKQ